MTSLLYRVTISLQCSYNIITVWKHACR